MYLLCKTITQHTLWATSDDRWQSLPGIWLLLIGMEWRGMSEERTVEFSQVLFSTEKNIALTFEDTYLHRHMEILGYQSSDSRTELQGRWSGATTVQYRVESTLGHGLSDGQEPCRWWGVRRLRSHLPSFRLGSPMRAMLKI